MDRAVQEEMDNINESIQDINDIKPLKESIKKHIDSIASHLQTFQESEAVRLKESEEHIKKLTEKIAKMEVDSEHLRSHLEKTEQQAFKDILTGIPNRHAYEVRIAEEIARCHRYGSDLCMIVWDVDNFKSINDSYGHAAGDRVLKVIAETLNDCIRETDFLARFGGEEFILLLPGTSLEPAQQVAEKLRETISGTPFHFRDSSVSVTVSGGIAQLNKDENANSLFERADKALYQAKDKGRNLTSVAE
jgi:diguanylate cyclase